MKTDPDILTKFQHLYIEEFGEHLSESDALDILTRFTNVLRVLNTTHFANLADEDNFQSDRFDVGQKTGTLKSL